MPERADDGRDADGSGADGSRADAEPSGRDERVRAELAALGDGADESAVDGDRSAPGASAELPTDALREAERLTRLARRAVDDAEAAAYRENRARVLGEHDFAATVREDEGGEVLVCHPAEWLADAGDADATDADQIGSDDGPAIDPERIEDVDRAREVPLEGAADPDGWEAVDERNRELADRVREAHGDVHGANAAALAEYASNHYAKPVAALSGAELRHFREEYYPRNVWPTDEQRAALSRSLELIYEELDVPMPGA